MKNLIKTPQNEIGYIRIPYLYRPEMRRWVFNIDISVQLLMEYPSLSMLEPPIQKSLTMSGRWDVLCRCISAAKRLNDLFSEVTFHGFLTKDSHFCLSIFPEDWDKWSYTESGNAYAIREFLLANDHDANAHKISLKIEDIVSIRENIFLLEEGAPFLTSVFSNTDLLQQYTFLLGSEEGHSRMVKSSLLSLGNCQKISLGPKSYLSSQCITLLGYYLMLHKETR